MLERAQRRGGGQLAAADREAQAVAGHRIDEPGRVAGEQQPVDRGAASTSTASGPSTTGGPREPRVGERGRAAADRARSSRASSAAGSRSSASPGRDGLDEADVGQAAGNRRDADVPPAPDVHLAERRVDGADRVDV